MLLSRMLLRLIFRVACGRTRKRQRSIHARPSDGEDDDGEEEEDEEAAEERVKKGMVSFQGVRWMNVPPDMEERQERQQARQRPTRALAALTSLSRVSKETKLRLRVIFLDDSERSFEVEVRSSKVTFIKSSFEAPQYLSVLIIIL